MLYKDTVFDFEKLNFKNKMKDTMNIYDVKNILYLLFCLLILHNNRLVPLDIKIGNIFFYHPTYFLCDFGTTKKLAKNSFNDIQPRCDRFAPSCKTNLFEMQQLYFFFPAFLRS